MTPEIREWLIAAGIRALKTMAQTLIAVLSTAVVLQDVDWMMALSAAALSGILSILTSIAGIPEVAGGQPLREIVADNENER